MVGVRTSKNNPEVKRVATWEAYYNSTRLLAVVSCAEYELSPSSHWTGTVHGLTNPSPALTDGYQCLA